MFSIRKFVGFSATALGLGVIFVIALAPQAGLAAVPSSDKLHGPAFALHVAVHAVTPSADCTQAKQALAAAKTQDVAEDATEKGKPEDKAEDTAEKAAMKVLSDAARKACAPPVTAQCASARTALDAAKAKDVIEDAAEKGQPEDKAEAAAMKPLRDAVRAACEPQKPAPSAACVAAKLALKTARDQDKIEDKSEKKPASDADKAQDKIEDKAEHDQMRPLQQAVRAACGHGK